MALAYLWKKKANKIDRTEYLDDDEGFQRCKAKLNTFLSSETDGTLDKKYIYDPALRSARWVWFKNFIFPVCLPTAACFYVSRRVPIEKYVRYAGYTLSCVFGIKLYNRAFSEFDLRKEQTIKVLECPTPMGQELRDILYAHDANHFLLEKYETLRNEHLRQQKKKMFKKGSFNEFYSKRWELNPDNDNYLHRQKVSNNENNEYISLDKEIYGNTTFIPEYKVPKQQTINNEERSRTIIKELNYIRNKVDTKVINEINTIFKDDKNSIDIDLKKNGKIRKLDLLPKNVKTNVQQNDYNDREWLTNIGITDEMDQNTYLNDDNSNPMRPDCSNLEQRIRELSLKKNLTKKDPEYQDLIKQYRLCYAQNMIEDLKNL